MSCWTRLNRETAEDHTLLGLPRRVEIPVFFMVLLGAVTSLGLGMAPMRFVTTLLYGVNATDESMISLPAAVLLAAACLAALPAVFRAVRVDSVIMLRSQ